MIDHISALESVVVAVVLIVDVIAPLIVAVHVNSNAAVILMLDTDGLSRHRI